MLLSGVNNIRAQLYELEYQRLKVSRETKRNEAKCYGEGEETARVRNFLVIARPHRRRNPKGGNIRGIGKRQACKWTDRSNFLGARTRPVHG